MEVLKMSCSSKNVDRLSSIPEELISRILSSMPTKYAVRTSILSKSWRYRWTSVTNLDFDDEHPVYTLPVLSTFVERVLDLRTTSQVNLFRLRFSKRWAHKANISKWINQAIRLNVREVDINVNMLDLPESLYTCKTLTKLRLVSRAPDWDIFECPSHINLPCLKTLDMDNFSNPSVNAYKLISGCPILESLSLKVTCSSNHEDLKLNISTLKRLKLKTRKGASAINKIILNVPNLEYLFVGGILHSLFVIEDLSSLVETSISRIQLDDNHHLAELLKGISGTKSLSFSTSYISDPFTSPMPIFPNLKNLEIPFCYNSSGWLIIPQILENSSELEHLCIVKPRESCWIEPISVPTCMLTNLRTMKFTNYNGWECDTQFLKYMLGNAEVLKTLTITCEGSCIQEEMQLYVNLLKLPRASKYCEIHFIGSWGQYTE